MLIANSIKLAQLQLFHPAPIKLIPDALELFNANVIQFCFYRELFTIKPISYAHPTKTWT